MTQEEIDQLSIAIADKMFEMRCPCGLNHEMKANHADDHKWVHDMRNGEKFVKKTVGGLFLVTFFSGILTAIWMGLRLLMTQGAR